MINAEEKLARLAALKASFNKTKSEQSNFVYTKFFQFWKMDPGTQIVVRFLPDANKDNPRNFLVENHTHTLMVNGKKRVVACLEMYDGYGSCPICKLSREYYAKAKAAGETKENPGPLTALGKKYYRKLEYLGQVHVVSSPIDYEKNEGHEYEMPISIGPQIFALINAAFTSGDLDAPPYDFKGGYDFRIAKLLQGTDANYATSKFVPRPSDLDDDLIANFNLYDLSTLRNRRMDPAILELMLIADTTGEQVDLKAAYAGNEGHDESGTTPEYSTPAVQTVVASDTSSSPAPTQEAQPQAASSAQKANEVLAQIRAKIAADKAAG